MEFPVPAYTSFTIPTGATTGARITFNETGDGSIKVYNSLNVLVAEINTSGDVISYPTVNAAIVQLSNGRIQFGNDDTNSPYIRAGDTTGGNIEHNTGIDLLGTTNDALWVEEQSGKGGKKTGDSTAPHMAIFDQLGTSAADFYVSGSMIATDLSGALRTWQTPTYNTGWTGLTTFAGITPVPTLRYRLTAENEVWFYGCFGINAAGAGGVPFAVPSGYFDSAKALSFPIQELPATGLPFTWGFGYVTTGGNFHVDIPAGFTRNNGDTFFVNVKCPLGNLT